MTARPEDTLTGPDRYAWMEYERHLMVLNRSPRTIQGYGEAALKLAAHIAPTPLLEATRAQVEQFLIHVRQVNSVGSQANRFRSLRALYSWLEDEEIITRSPMRRIGRPQGAQKVPRVLESAEKAALRASCQPKEKTWAGYRDAAVLELWLGPGSPRLAEMAGITLDDVKITGKATILIRGKGNKERLIPPSDAACGLLLRYLRHRAAHKLAASGLLWLGERPGFGARGLAQMLAHRSAAAGIGHVHPHQLRHTAWHDWRLNGGDIDDGMLLWGWSQVEMALMYGRSAAVARALEAGRQLGRAS
jgi:site-specific recombinase XerD